MKTYLVALSLSILMGLTNASAVPLITGIPLQNDDGVTTDLFDVAQGTVVTNSSPLFSRFNAEGTFGSTAPQAIEGFRTIFADTPITTDFIEFMTLNSIDLTGYRFVLGEDSSGSGNRSATSFRLYASNNAGDVLSHLVSAASIAQTYTVNYGSPQIAITDSISVANVKFFRMEVDRTHNSGPRIFELDGFGTVVPEPSSIVIATSALILLAASTGTRNRPFRLNNS
jgi:hypothetical protein